MNGWTIGRTNRLKDRRTDGQADGRNGGHAVGPSINYLLDFGPVRNSSALFSADQGFFFLTPLSSMKRVDPLARRVT